jgi:hypothetical protein
MGWVFLVVGVGTMIWFMSARFSRRDEPNMPRSWWGRDRRAQVDHDFWEKWREQRAEQWRKGNEEE